MEDIAQGQHSESYWSTPEFEAFKRGLWNFYLHVRAGFAKFSQSGWRAAFCWAAGLIMAKALYVAFVTHAEQHFAMPDNFYAALLIAFAMVLAAMGLRTFEKIQLGAFALEQTRRIEQQGTV